MAARTSTGGGDPTRAAGSGSEAKEPEELPFVFSSDPRQLEVERKIARVYDVYDVQKLRLIDIKEVPFMVRALDLCPTEVEMQELTQKVDEPGDKKGQVKYGTFIQYMTPIMMEQTKYLYYTKDDMMRFFQKFDREKRGTVDAQKLRDVLAREGEAFSYEEMEEMISFATNKETGLIHYEEYVDKLMNALKTKIV